MRNVGGALGWVGGEVGARAGAGYSPLLAMFLWALLREYGKAFHIPHCLLWFVWPPSGLIWKGFPYFTLFAMVFVESSLRELG